MKLGIAVTTFALALAACALNPSQSLADDHVANQSKVLSISDQVIQLRKDIAADMYSCVELSERIDNLVRRIDTMLDNNAENEGKLIRQRKIVLGLRSLIKCDHSTDDNGALLTGALCNSGGGEIAQVNYSSGGGFFGVPGKVGGGGGGGGGAGSGLGRLVLWSGLAAAITIPIAVSTGSDGGDEASPSG